MEQARCLNDKIRISVQLVNSQDQSFVFTGTYDEALDSLLEAQDNIIQQIAAVLQEKIDHNSLSHSYRKESVNLAANENYLLGMHTLKKGTAQSDVNARKFFNAVIKTNPRYSLACTGLSLSYFNFWSCMLWDRWDLAHKGAHKHA